MAAAKKYLPDFGVGAYCGFGRMKQEKLQAVLPDGMSILGVEELSECIGLEGGRCPRR